MNAETIKDFLVSLGFQVDDAGAKKFESVVLGATGNVIKMGAAVEAAALTVVAFTAKIASGLDNLYWASQRTGATVNGIRQISYAVSQMGGSVDAARGSLESLSRFVRNNPGAEGFLNRLGVQTRDARGNMRDMASIFTGVGQKLSSMPYYRANQYAQMLGIDENTLLAMRRGIGEYTAQYTQMAKAIGYNADAAAVSSNKFMTALSSFGQMAGMARDKIGSNLAEGLAGSLDNLRKLVIDNFPKIEDAITKGVKGILVLAEVIGRVIFRLIEAAGDIREWWRSLDQTTRELIEIFGGLVIAWRILNSAFLTSPIGIITLLAASIIGLYDDYKTWKDGGKSLIDWGKWEPDIKAALKNIGEMTDSVKDLAKEAANLFGIDPKEWSLKWEFSNLTHNLGELGKMLTMIGELLNAINEGRWSDAASIGKNILKQGNDQPDAMPGVTRNAQETRSAIISWYQRGNAQLNQILPAWLGGSAPPPTVHGTPEAAMDIPGQNLPDRNNNPGNLRPVGGKGFRSFNSAIEGWDAMRNQLMRYFTGKTTGRVLKSITDIVSTWAPSSENDTGKYISDISKWMGVAPDAALNLNNPQVMTSLMQSMARKEGFSNWNSPLAARSAGASVSQETNIHIHGVSDPERAGMAVAERQMGVNSRLTQQLTPGVK